MDETNGYPARRPREGRRAGTVDPGAALVALLVTGCATAPPAEVLDADRVGHSDAFSRTKPPPPRPRPPVEAPALRARETSIDLTGVRLGPLGGDVPDEEGEDAGSDEGSDAGFDEGPGPELPPPVSEPPAGAGSDPG